MRLRFAVRRRDLGLVETIYSHSQSVARKSVWVEVPPMAEVIGAA
jgi:hypothetical protein